MKAQLQRKAAWGLNREVIIMEASKEPISDRAHLFFLDGPGGTGKTFLYNTQINFIQGQDWKVMAVASTGIASTLLTDGVTFHSKFKIYPPITETTVSKVKRWGYLRVITSRVYFTIRVIWYTTGYLTWNYFISNFCLLRLVQNMRITEGSQLFAAWLIHFGNGTLPTITRLGPDVFKIPSEFLLTQRDEPHSYWPLTESCFSVVAKLLYLLKI